MTTETVEREPALYITDAELIRRMGVPEKIARAVISGPLNDFNCLLAILRPSGAR